MKIFQNKPKSVRYTDMAIWIDNHVYTDDCDNQILFEYLYHLSKMLAFKRGLLIKRLPRVSEDFALYCASKYFLRLTDSRQNIVKENGDTELKKIKSILNYIKKTIFPLKVDFEREYGVQECMPIKESPADSFSDFRISLEDTIDGIRITDFECYMHDIPKTIKVFLSKIPYASDRAVWENIYLSCLLSFLSSVTLQNATINKINQTDGKVLRKKGYIDKLYYREKKNSTILYHLDESMRDYITVLVNEIRRVIAKDLSDILYYPLQTPSRMKELLLQSINEDDMGDNE